MRFSAGGVDVGFSAFFSFFLGGLVKISIRVYTVAQAHYTSAFRIRAVCQASYPVAPVATAEQATATATVPRAREHVDPPPDPTDLTSPPTGAVAMELVSVMLDDFSFPFGLLFVTA